jgi:hypothetical protein
MFIRVFQSNSMETEGHLELAKRKWICRHLCVRNWRRRKFHLRLQPIYKILHKFKKISRAAPHLHLLKSNLMILEVQPLLVLLKGLQLLRNPTFTNHSLNQLKNRLIM